MRFLVVCVLLCMAAKAYSGVPGVTMPLHASCKINWKWPSTKCSQIQSSIVDQMKKWESDENCKNGGEKCLYKLKSQDANSITATHETPVKHYLDDLSFKFVDSAQNDCECEAFSTSETWYAVLDYGTNYCNLHNLITGAELDKINGFTENTSDSVCTQYSTNNCTVY